MALFDEPFRQVPSRPSEAAPAADVAVVDAATPADPVPAPATAAAPVEPAAPAVESPETGEPASESIVAVHQPVAELVTRPQHELRRADDHAGPIVFSRVVVAEPNPSMPREPQRLVSGLDDGDPVLDQLRSLAASLHQARTGRELKVIAVTSSVSGEGKTLLAANLALTLSRSYMRQVLLIDADLRRPKIGKLLGKGGRQPGLSDLVAGQAQLSQCVLHDERHGIHILTAGTVPPNPLEMLSSKRFTEAMQVLKGQFDAIVVDTAPLQLVSDALVLSQLATSVLYVVKADATPYQVARNGLKKLRRANAPIAGVVLNHLDLERADRYYGEYSGYKGYGKYGYSKTYGSSG